MCTFFLFGFHRHVCISNFIIRGSREVNPATAVLTKAYKSDWSRSYIWNLELRSYWIFRKTDNQSNMRTYKMLTFLFLNETLWYDHSLELSLGDDSNDGHIVRFGCDLRKLSWKLFRSFALNCGCRLNAWASLLILPSEGCRENRFTIRSTRRQIDVCLNNRLRGFYNLVKLAQCGEKMVSRLEHNLQSEQPKSLSGLSCFQGLAKDHR